MLNVVLPATLLDAVQPSFSAQNAIHRLQKKYPDYQYREPSLNPTNVKDRATDWEVGLIREFQAADTRAEISGEIGEGADRRFYVARPIRLTNAACLECHSVPAVAPGAMVAKFGPVNGFGWSMGDIVALQVVEVPSQPARDKALRSVLVTVGSLACVFVLSAAVFLLLLRRHVTHPLERLTRAANSISVDESSRDGSTAAEGGQFSELQDAINRLKSSIDSALKRIASTNKPDDGSSK
jgi:protein-histidine pros-kinase